MIEWIKNDFWQLQITPEIGASILNLRARINNRFVPILRETPISTLAKKSSSALSSFILAPFSNRIRDARFAFAGQDFQLRSTAPDGSTQHGDVRNKPWTVVKPNEHTLEAWFDSRAFTDFNFPFAITMNVTYSLVGSVLEMRLELRNLSDQTMPAGIGLHPYFVRSIMGLDEMRLRFKAGGVYVTDDSLIPTRAMQAIPENLDFSSERTVGGQSLNHGFGAWDGMATLDYTVARVVIQADPIFSHLVVFTAPDGSLGLEPVTNATDGFNLMTRGVTGTGVVVLKPGAALTGSVRFKLELS